MERNQMRLASFFAGMAGFDLGFDQAGIETDFLCEIEEDCQTVLKARFKEAFGVSDIRSLIAKMQRIKRGQKINDYEWWKELIQLLRSTDVFCGGFPCQDISVAGLRAGLAGQRSGLWFAFRRVIALFRPPWVVIENVPGLLSSNEGRDLAIILSGLAELGYGWSYRLLDTQYFGLAQRRERLFIVASIGSMRCAEVLFERESLCWDPPPRREEGQSVTPPVAGCSNGGGANGPGRTADDAESLVVGGLPDVAGTLGSRIGGARTTDLDQHGAYVPVARPLRAKHNDSHRDDSSTYVVGHFTEVTAEGWKKSEGTWLASHEAKEPHTLITKQPTPLQSVNRAQAKDQNGSGIGKPGEPMYTLTGVDHHAIAFDPTQITSPDNRNNPKPGDPCHTLPAKGHPPTIAFHGAQDPDTSKEVSHPVGTNRGLDMCVFKPSHDADKGDQEPIVFQPKYYTRENKTGGAPDNVHPPLDAAISRASGDAIPAVASGVQVRRLTPKECLRLQGFPDDWFDGLDLSDSAKYRMCGNAVSVPVAKFIAERLLKTNDEWTKNQT